MNIIKKLTALISAAAVVFGAASYAAVQKSSGVDFDDFTEPGQEQIAGCEFGNMPAAGSEYEGLYGWTPEKGVFGKNESDTSFKFVSKWDGASLPQGHTNPYLQFAIKDGDYKKGDAVHLSFNLARSGGSTNMYVQVRPDTADGSAKWFLAQSVLDLRTWSYGAGSDFMLVNGVQQTGVFEYDKWHKVDIVYYPVYETSVNGAAGEYTVMDLYIDGEKIADKTVMDADGSKEGYQTMTGISFIRFAFDPRVYEGTFPETRIYLDDIKYELLDSEPAISDPSGYILGSEFTINYADGTVPYVHPYTPVSMLLDGLTLAEGCTADVTDAAGEPAAAGEDLQNGMVLNVRSGGDVRTYTINVYGMAVDVDFDDWDNKFYYGGPNNDYKGYSFAGPALSEDAVPADVAYFETVGEPGRGNVLHTHSESNYSTAGYSHMNIIKNETPAKTEIGSKFVLEYSAKVGAGTGAGLQCKYYDKDGGDNFANPIYLSKGIIRVFNSSVGTYTDNKWYDIKAYCDSTTGEIAVYINGMEAYKGTDSAVSSFDSFSNIRLTQHYCEKDLIADSWIDNVKIYGVSGLTESFLETMDNTLSSDRYFVEGEYINGYYGLSAGELIEYAILSDGAEIEVFEADGITPAAPEAPAKKGMMVRVTAKDGGSSKNYLLDIERYNISDIKYTVNGKPTDHKFTGGTLEASVSVTNYADVPVSVTPIIAQYKDGALAGLSYKTLSAEGGGAVTEASASFDITETEDTKIKIMVFDSIAGMNPLCKPAELEPFSNEQIESVEIYYPGYTTKAITFSFDDCIAQDARIADILDSAGLKAAFNLITNNFNKLSEAGRQEVLERYEGHETANHTRSHPRMYLTEDAEIDGVLYSPVTLEDCKADISGGSEDIAGLFGKAPEGMAWPYTRPSERADYDELLEYIKSLGIKYIRPVDETGNFDLPEDWYDWRATCHTDRVKYYIDEFLSLDTGGELKLFYIWGHGFELDETYDPENTSKFRWSDLEALAERLKDRDDIWKATNIEIHDYVEAAKALNVDYDNNIITNDSDVDVYVRINGNDAVVPAHGTGTL